MASFNPIVSKYRKDDGTYRVFIRVIHHRRYKDVPTPFYVTSDQITRGGKLKDARIIDLVENKIKEYKESSYKLGFLADGLDVEHYVELLKNNVERIDFIQFWDEQIRAMLKAGRDGNAQTSKICKNKLYKFNKSKPLYLDQITQEYVLSYFESLQNLKANTILCYMNAFKAIYSKAQKRFNNTTLNIIHARYGVFDLVEMPKKETAKDNAFKEIGEMQTLIDLPYTGTWRYDFTKDMFILSFVCFGTNMADWERMTKDQYVDGILTYRRKKTEKMSGDGVEMKIMVPEVGRIILEKYSGDKHYLIDFSGHSRFGFHTKGIHYFFQEAGWEDKSKCWNDIGNHRGKYTFYANRHTMASFARNICKVEYMTVHEMLNHVAPSSFKTTDTYLWKDFKPLWEANEKLLALFDWSFYLNQAKNKKSAEE